MLLCEQLLGTGAKSAYVLGWVKERLQEAEAAEPERFETQLLWGLLNLNSGLGRDQVLVRWRKAKELGASGALLRNVAKLYERAYGRDRSFEELLR